MKAIKFEISFGVVSGYISNDVPQDTALEKVISAWKDAAAIAHEETGIFISAQFTAAIVIYPFANDIISETVVSVSGISNTRHSSNDDYMAVVSHIIENVKQKLQQKTATLIAYEVESCRV